MFVHRMDELASTNKADAGRAGADINQQGISGQRMIGAHAERPQSTVIQSGGFGSVDNFQINAEAIANALNEHVAVIRLAQGAGGDRADIDDAVCSGGGHDAGESLDHRVHRFAIKFPAGEARGQLDRKNQIFKNALVLAIDFSQERPHRARAAIDHRDGVLCTAAFDPTTRLQRRPAESDSFDPMLWGGGVMRRADAARLAGRWMNLRAFSRRRNCFALRHSPHRSQALVDRQDKAVLSRFTPVEETYRPRPHANPLGLV